MSQSKANPEPTEIAGRYTIVQKLGAGAFGTVYKAKDKILGRMVAIKTIRMEGLAAAAAGVEEMVARFEREARVSAQLKHPNIVTIYDIGQAEGMSYLAMEFIDGVGLEKIIAQAGKLSVDRAASIGAQVADGLDFAHKNSVVHRDIKPANIMIEPGDRVKVTDFGIAKATDSGDHLTMTGSLLGTPSYMSPEQARGSPLDGRSDLFAVGCVLYEMLTGKKAFSGASITGLIFKIITEEPTPIREVDPDVPEEMARIIARALSKAADTRYQSGREMADDLLALVKPGSTPTIRQAEVATSPGLLTGPEGPPTIQTPPTVSRAAPPTVAQAPPTRVSAPPPVPVARPAPPLARPAAKRGSALPLIALGSVLLVLAGIAATAGWFLFLRKPAGASVADTTTSPTATLAPAATAPPATEAAANAGLAAPATVAAALPQTAPPLTAPVGVGAGTSPASRPPAPTSAGARPGAPRPPAASGEQASFLDEEPVEAQPDGAEAGRRVAETFRGGSSTGNFGASGRFQPRERTPRNLAVAERPAVATMRHVMDAEESFFRRNSRYGNLVELKEAGTLFVDVQIQPTNFLRKGYRFEVTATGDSFKVAAVPLTGGSRPFVGDDSGYIRAGVD